MSTHGKLLSVSTAVLILLSATHGVRSQLPGGGPGSSPGWEFLVEPVGGSATCQGQLRYTVKTYAGSLTLGGDSCNYQDKWYKSTYSSVGDASAAIYAGLNKISFNGHTERCGASDAGFYIEGWANPRPACVRLYRKHRHGLFNWSCDNKEHYDFKITVYNNGKMMQVNVKDSSEISCPNANGGTDGSSGSDSQGTSSGSGPVQGCKFGLDGCSVCNGVRVCK